MPLIQMKSKIRTYSELIRIPTFEERLEYLRLNGEVGADTFGFDRIFNQMFYTGSEWRSWRNHIISRDNGCDLAHPDYEIRDFRSEKSKKPYIVIHHMNPIDINDIRNATEYLLDSEFLVCCSLSTHNAIHYGRKLPVAPRGLDERYPGDTCPWKKR